MHSSTIAPARSSAAIAIMRSCSITLVRPGRNTGSSLPSGPISRGSEPVVFA
jgi:hypothetical protein